MNNNIKNFYDLDAWKKSHDLVLEVYKITNKFPDTEKYGITNQLRRATYSITANLAEGFSRYHYKDKIRFYYQARGSLSEVQSFLILVKDLKFINLEDFNRIGVKTKNVAMLINGLIRSTEKMLKK